MILALTASLSDFFADLLSESLGGIIAAILMAVASGLIRWRELFRRETLLKFLSKRAIFTALAILAAAYALWYYRLPGYKKSEHRDHLRFRIAWIMSGFREQSPLEAQIEIPDNLSEIVYKGIPTTQNPLKIIFHTHAAIGYDEDLGAPKWIAFSLPNSRNEKYNNFYGFRPDSRIGFPNPTLAADSVYEAGLHLAPVAPPSLTGSNGQEAYNDALKTSNLAAMTEEMVASLESLKPHIASFSEHVDRSYLVMGPIFNDRPITIEGLPVPDSIFISMIGSSNDKVLNRNLILASDGGFSSATIAEIEEMTGILLYPSL